MVSQQKHDHANPDSDEIDVVGVLLLMTYDHQDHQHCRYPSGDQPARSKLTMPTPL
jgi:hypothetical protein